MFWETALLKDRYHPKALLTKKRNVRLGLQARTRILFLLEKGASTTKAIGEETRLSYATALHHLHLLEGEAVVTREGRKIYRWQLTGAGQQRLTDLT